MNELFDYHLATDHKVWLSWSIFDHDVQVFDGERFVELEDHPEMLKQVTERVLPPCSVTYPINRWSIVHETAEWSGGNYQELLEFIYSRYQQPLTAAMKAHLLAEDPRDLFDYIKHAQIGQPILRLMGDLRHFEGFEVCVLEGKVEIELNLGS